MNEGGELLTKESTTGMSCQHPNDDLICPAPRMAGRGTGQKTALSLVQVLVSVSFVGAGDHILTLGIQLRTSLLR